MSSDQACPDTMSIGYQIITWVLVVGGWLVVHHFSTKREVRKEIRSQIDSFVNELRELEESAINYHLSTTYDQELARQIKCSLEHLRLKLHYLNILDKSDRLNKILKLRRSITSTNFDTVNHIPHEIDSQLVGNISNSIDSLIHALETSFRKIFPNPWIKN